MLNTLSKQPRQLSASYSMNNSSSFITLPNGTVKRRRHKTSYKDIYLERLNFIPTEMPCSKRRDSGYSVIYQNTSMNLSKDEMGLNGSGIDDNRFQPQNKSVMITTNKRLNETDANIKKRNAHKRGKTMAANSTTGAHKVKKTNNTNDNNDNSALAPGNMSTEMRSMKGKSFVATRPYQKNTRERKGKNKSTKKGDEMILAGLGTDRSFEQKMSAQFGGNDSNGNDVHVNKGTKKDNVSKNGNGDNGNQGTFHVGGSNKRNLPSFILPGDENKDKLLTGSLMDGQGNDVDDNNMMHEITNRLKNAIKQQEQKENENEEENMEDLKEPINDIDDVKESLDLKISENELKYSKKETEFLHTDTYKDDVNEDSKHLNNNYNEYDNSHHNGHFSNNKNNTINNTNNNNQMYYTSNEDGINKPLRIEELSTQNTKNNNNNKEQFDNNNNGNDMNENAFHYKDKENNENTNQFNDNENGILTESGKHNISPHSSIPKEYYNNEDYDKSNNYSHQHNTVDPSDMVKKKILENYRKNKALNEGDEDNENQNNNNNNNNINYNNGIDSNNNNYNLTDNDNNSLQYSQNYNNNNNNNNYNQGSLSSQQKTSPKKEEVPLKLCNRLFQTDFIKKSRDTTPKTRSKQFSPQHTSHSRSFTSSPFIQSPNYQTNNQNKLYNISNSNEQQLDSNNTKIPFKQNENKKDLLMNRYNDDNDNDIMISSKNDNTNDEQITSQNNLKGSGSVNMSGNNLYNKSDYIVSSTQKSNALNEYASGVSSEVKKSNMKGSSRFGKDVDLGKSDNSVNYNSGGFNARNGDVSQNEGGCNLLETVFDKQESENGKNEGGNKIKNEDNENEFENEQEMQNENDIKDSNGNEIKKDNYIPKGNNQNNEENGLDDNKGDFDENANTNEINDNMMYTFANYKNYNNNDSPNPNNNDYLNIKNDNNDYLNNNNRDNDYLNNKNNDYQNHNHNNNHLNNNNDYLNNNNNNNDYLNNKNDNKDNIDYLNNKSHQNDYLNNQNEDDYHKPSKTNDYFNNDYNTNNNNNNDYPHHNEYNNNKYNNNNSNIIGNNNINANANNSKTNVYQINSPNNKGENNYNLIEEPNDKFSRGNKHNDGINSISNPPGQQNETNSNNIHNNNYNIRESNDYYTLGKPDTISQRYNNNENSNNNQNPNLTTKTDQSSINYPYSSEQNQAFKSSTQYDSNNNNNNINLPNSQTIISSNETKPNNINSNTQYNVDTINEQTDNKDIPISQQLINDPLNTNINTDKYYNTNPFISNNTNNNSVNNNNNMINNNNNQNNFPSKDFSSITSDNIDTNYNHSNTLHNYSKPKNNPFIDNNNNNKNTNPSLSQSQPLLSTSQPLQDTLQTHKDTLHSNYSLSQKSIPINPQNPSEFKDSTLSNPVITSNSNDENIKPTNPLLYKSTDSKFVIEDNNSNANSARKVTDNNKEQLPEGEEYEDEEGEEYEDEEGEEYEDDFNEDDERVRAYEGYRFYKPKDEIKEEDEEYDESLKTSQVIGNSSQKGRIDMKKVNEMLDHHIKMQLKEGNEDGTNGEQDKHEIRKIKSKKSGRGKKHSKGKNWQSGDVHMKESVNDEGKERGDGVTEFNNSNGFGNNNENKEIKYEDGNDRSDYNKTDINKGMNEHNVTNSIGKGSGNNEYYNSDNNHNDNEHNNVHNENDIYNTNNASLKQSKQDEERLEEIKSLLNKNSKSPQIDNSNNNNNFNINNNNQDIFTNPNYNSNNNNSNITNQNIPTHQSQTTNQNISSSNLQNNPFQHHQLLNTNTKTASTQSDLLPYETSSHTKAQSIPLAISHQTDLITPAKPKPLPYFQVSSIHVELRDNSNEKSKTPKAGTSNNPLSKKQGTNTDEDIKVYNVNTLNVNSNLSKPVNLNKPTRLKHDMQKSAVDTEIVDSFITKQKLKNKTDLLSDLKQQKELELRLLKEKSALIAKQKEENIKRKKEQAQLLAKEIPSSNSKKALEIETRIKKLITKDPNNTKQQLNTNDDKYNSNYINERNVITYNETTPNYDNTINKKKPYVSIFANVDKQTPKTQIKKGSVLKNLDQITESGNDIKSKYYSKESDADFYDISKYDKLRNSNKGDKLSTQHRNTLENEPNNNNNNNNRRSSNLYLNKVKEDVKSIEMRKGFKEKYNGSGNNNITSPNTNYFQYNKLIRQDEPQRHHIAKAKFTGGFIMPANSLEDVIETRDIYFLNNNPSK